MLKKLLFIAVAILFFSPTLVFADDIFFAFGVGSDASSTSTATTADGSGSVFIYSDGNFAFNAADFLFTNSDPSVIQFTGGVIPNSVFNDVGGRKFDLPANLIVNSATDGETLLAGISENGVNPPLGKLFDPDYDASVTVSGTDGAFLLARVDYDIVGQGVANIDLALDPMNGVIQLVSNPDFDSTDPDSEPLLTIPLSPTLGSASLTVVAIPEPSSLALLMLGSVAMVTRRKRA